MLMKKQEDCFFYLESSDSDEGHILARCVDCQKNDDEGWFWKGSEKGYSKYDIRCSVCGKNIFVYEEKTEERIEKI